MASGYTTYLDPGAYHQEVLVPAGVNIPAQPFNACLIGTASRFRRAVNEPVRRGLVTEEFVAGDFTAVSGGYRVQLGSRAKKLRVATSVRRTLNGISTTVSTGKYSFDRATITGASATFDLDATSHGIGIEIDNKQGVTIMLRQSSDLTGLQPAGSFSAPDANDIQTLTLSTVTYRTLGARPGMTLSITDLGTNIDAANEGNRTILSIYEDSGNTVITFSNATGINESFSATEVGLAFSGTGLVGREIHQIATISSMAAATAAQVADGINAALEGASSLGFGSDYANFASVSGTTVVLTSPDTTAEEQSDIRILPTVLGSTWNTDIFGAASVDADSFITIDSSVWNASATWSISYIDETSTSDTLLNTPVERVISVGSQRGNGDFNSGDDFSLSGNTIDWSADTAASVVGTVATDFAIGANESISLQMDNLVVPSDLRGSSPSNKDVLVYFYSGTGADVVTNPPLGFVSAEVATTPAEAVVNLNAYASAAYGPRYRSIASGTTEITITSPTEGRRTSSIVLLSSDLVVSMFGTAYPPSSPSSGAGRVPSLGQVYYVTYEYDRPATDFNVPVRFASLEAAEAFLGSVDINTPAYNPLAIASRVAFGHKARFIYTIIINDEDGDGAPSNAAIRDAIDAAGQVSGATELVLVGEPGTRADIIGDMVSHIEDQCSLAVRQPRRAFFGVARDTEIGSRDQSDTIVGRAAGTLQVSATSSARGRLFLVAPPQQAGVSINVKFADDEDRDVELDSTYLAVAVAALRTSLPRPSDTLTRRTLSVFNVSDITRPWLKQERQDMAGQGVFVVSLDRGLLRMLDAMSTEGGGGGKDAFKVDSTSYQKDVVTGKVSAALDANLVGVVPYDLAGFIIDIKLLIQGIVTSEIGRSCGPFRTASGSVRAMDPRTDIKVLYDPNNPTEFNYRYTFNLAYPALRFFGEYSVDSPLVALLSD